MSVENGLVCPVERAGSLDSKLRKLLQNPVKILSPFVKPEMKVLDMGCGPGFFSIEMAKMVGEGGKVYAADLQEGMLQKVKDKIQGTVLESIVVPVMCDGGSISIDESVDFILAFYMVHEVSDKEGLFKKLFSLLSENGRMLIVEPKFHVKKDVFEDTVGIAANEGFKVSSGPKLPFSFSSILTKS